ncbi:MAG: DoxX family protein, partial [Porphyromonadaceae bacterium]|nr:DoxX family protein [Porphyromonadaceae bacterium]
MIQKFLFPSKPDATGYSILLLGFRILFGILMMTHGLQKWDNFDALSATFPDPVGVGSTISLSLAIFAEVICSVAFILGALYRLA